MGGALHPGFEDHQRGSDAFRKFSTITDSSTAYQECVLTGSDPIRSVLSIELSRFYHAPSSEERYAPATSLKVIHVAALLRTFLYWQREGPPSSLRDPWWLSKK